jgi:sarcosine oxidase subunit alpha
VGAPEVIERGLAVIGGGPAGLAAAIAAKEAGADVVLIERDRILGGILNQCIHDGFGLHRFGEALSGPEYAGRFIDRQRELGIPVMRNTIVLKLSRDRRLLTSQAGRLTEIRAGAVVLATGCRERPRGALSIPGHRPSGVYTAGAAQSFVNMENIMPGKRVCILGSGDIGLIMARRMTLEGAKVEAVFEIMPWSGGLPRNIRQCLSDYGIPLFLSTTIVGVSGMGRLEGVTAARVDERGQPVKGTERFFPCDTLLLSVGLIPENELAREAGIALDPLTGGALADENCMTDAEGIFSCGNALHVHDLADMASEEAERAGRCAAAYVSGGPLSPGGPSVEIRPGLNVRYVVPGRVSLPGASRGRDGVALAFRVTAPRREAVVRITGGDVTVREERYPRLHPAEMVWTRLRGEDLGGLEKRVRALEVNVL